MKITGIRVQNVLGVASAEVDTSNSVLLVTAAGNRRGKSSLKEAIALCLLGESERTPAKKDWDKLVHEGAMAGAVIVNFDSGDVANLSLPSGNGASPLKALDDVQKQAWAVAMGNVQLSHHSVKDKDRRALVTKLLGEANAHDVMAAKLIELGHIKSNVDAITPLLRLGADAAQAEVAVKAREAKAQWRTLTGETWGAAKGPEWVPSGDCPPKPKRTLDQCDSDIHIKDAAIAATQRKIGAAKTAPSPDEIAAIMGRAALHAGNMRDLGEAENAVRGTQVSIGIVRDSLAGASGTNVQACPCCEKLLVIEDGSSLAEFRKPTAKRISEWEDELEELTVELAQRESALTTAKLAQQDSARAKFQMEGIDQMPEYDLKKLEDELESQAADRSALSFQRENIAAYHAWIKARDGAQTKHQEIVEWTSLGASLGDPDLGAGSGVNPVYRLNDELKVITEGIGWPTVVLGESGSLHFMGRPIAFCSVSEHWMVDAALSIAFARLTGIGIVMLDGVDVLEPITRPGLFKWLSESSGLSNALTFITLKEPPKMPSTVATIWMGDMQEEAA